MYTTQGIILKKYDIGETDALFTIYTKDFGKIRTLAQGIKKEEAKLKGHLEPLSLSEIQFIQGKNGFRLTHAELKRFWPDIRVNKEKLALAWSLVGLTDKECFEETKDEALWETFLGHFAVLENTGDFDDQKAKVLFESFRRGLSSALGYAGERTFSA